MKNRLRKRIKRRIADMSAAEREQASGRAAERMLALEEFDAASVVMAYLPIAGEPDTAEVILEAWRRGKRVLAPRVDWDRRHMVGVELQSLDEGVTPGRYGIPEPDGGFPHPVTEIDFVIVPALAFDRAGGRLGRGGGFYDRFLAEPGLDAVACGLAFDVQLCDDLPTEAHDEQVDMLVTDRQVLRFRRASRR